MAEYNGRRAPNFSQYLDDLNAIPSPYDVAVQQQQQQEGFNFDSDLSLFTNTEFFDFDLNLPPFEPIEENNQKGNNVNQKSDMEFLDMLGDGFGNNDYVAPQMNQMNNAMPVQNAQFQAMPQANNMPNVQSNVNRSSSISSPTTTSPAQSAAASSPTNHTSPAAPAPAPKRKNTAKTPALSVEEVARVAAEEDKRRRNTAASARFRIKKKMREQTLEKTVKDTTEKNAALEARVTALELENQWLKNLITEKNGKSAEEGKKAENNITAMFKKFLAAQKTEGERSNGNSKIGVGTI
ncbi:putative bZIP transcription factor (MetR) [Aspergillus stella-maris]|uniref:putative bZIP transcription factor (MetR) n=1 Tax=Aspergillus stella-maris TaxID=1810926 RepID=UPI003CCE0238